jgi:cytochrome c oxidase assembly protein subunit 15
MVASGLEPGRVAVAPVKLTLHLLLASVILALLAWAADGMRERRPRADGAGGVAAGAVFLVGLIFLQIAFGGLVAGAKAGWTYNTWPLMDGRLMPPPDALRAMGSGLDNLVANPALVQLNHRLTAYLVVAVALAHAWQVRIATPGSPAWGRAVGIAGLALGQMVLGIVTLLLAVPLWAGLAHQLLAMILLVAATLHARRCLRGAAAA